MKGRHEEETGMRRQSVEERVESACDLDGKQQGKKIIKGLLGYSSVCDLDLRSLLT